MGFKDDCLFPPDDYDNSDVNITAEDLFAEDWEIFHLRTFNDVLSEMYAGKTIRRKSWFPNKGIGKYAGVYALDYLDLLAEDWEVIDTVEEVDCIQVQHLKDRNEH